MRSGIIASKKRVVALRNFSTIVGRHTNGGGRFGSKATETWALYNMRLSLRIDKTRISHVAGLGSK